VIACFDGNVHTGSATRALGRAWSGYTAPTGGSASTAPTGNLVGIYTAYAAAKNDATGCESGTRTLVTVTINALPGVPNAGNVIACFDGNVHTGSATAGAGESVVWYNRRDRWQCDHSTFGHCGWNLHGVCGSEE
jgi:hypothetical protein